MRVCVGTSQPLASFIISNLMEGHVLTCKTLLIGGCDSPLESAGTWCPYKLVLKGHAKTPSLKACRNMIRACICRKMHLLLLSTWLLIQWVKRPFWCSSSSLYGDEYFSKSGKQCAQLLSLFFCTPFFFFFMSGFCSYSYRIALERLEDACGLNTLILKNVFSLLLPQNSWAQNWFSGVWVFQVITPFAHMWRFSWNQQ